MPVEQLLDLARAGVEKHGVEIAAVMLRLSIKDKVELRRVHNNVHQVGLRDELAEHVELIVAETGDEFLQPSILRAIGEAGERYLLRGLVEVFVASAVARGIDAAIGDRFIGYFTDRGEHVCMPGDPIPVTAPELKDLFGRALNSHPDNLGGSALPKVDYLRLLPDDLEGLELVLKPAPEAIGRLMARPLRVAFVFPNAALSESVWDEDEGRKRFFGVRPRDEAGQMETLCRLLTEAEDQGARAAVLPELSTTRALVEQLEAWMGEPNRRLKVLVAGSYHVEDRGCRRNTAAVLTASGVFMQHDKFNPFSFSKGSSTYTEDINAAARLTLSFHHRCLFSTLICKDLLEPGLTKLLVCAGLDLLMVPSLSQKTNGFEKKAGELTTDAQAVVAVVNSADVDVKNRPAAGIVSVPTLHSSCSQVFREDLNPPCVLLFDTSLARQASPWRSAWEPSEEA